jgi:hypothetical protein
VRLFSGATGSSLSSIGHGLPTRLHSAAFGSVASHYRAAKAGNHLG